MKAKQKTRDFNMGIMMLNSPRLRGLLYLLSFIASATTFGHMSEVCNLDGNDCTRREHTVIAFGVLAAVFALLLFMAVALEKRFLRISELVAAKMLVVFSGITAIMATLEKTLRDIGLDVSAEIIVGFAWLAGFMAVAGLYHFLVCGYGAVADDGGKRKKGKKVVEVEEAQAEKK